MRFGSYLWAGSGDSSLTFTLDVDPIRWSERPRDFEDGTAGSSLRNFYLTVGDSDYVWYSHEAETPSGSLQTGIDPGDFESAISLYTGSQIELPAGNLSSSLHADTLANMLTTMSGSGIISATTASIINDDGSWSLMVTSSVSITAGSRSWDDRGSSGLHGSHVYRPDVGGEVAGSNQFEITRLLGTRISETNDNDRIWAVQIALGDTISTSDANRPRLAYRTSTATTNPATNSEYLYDFGQLPASQIAAGRVATIFLTPEQALLLRTSINNSTGTSHWLTVHSGGGNDYIALPTASTYAGETSDEAVRVHTAGSQDPTVPQDYTSLNASFNFIVPMRLVYERDPCTTGEQRVRWGSFADYEDHPSNVTLPNSITAQRASVLGMEGLRIHSIFPGAFSGSVRYQLAISGTHTPDTPSAVGAVTYFSGGLGSSGTLVLAGSGSETQRVPDHDSMWVMFKGQGSVGRGEIGPGPYTVARPDQPSDWVRRDNDAGNRGDNPGEIDMTNGAGFGDETTVFPSPLSGSETQPDNHPSTYVEFFFPSMSIR